MPSDEISALIQQWKRLKPGWKYLDAAGLPADAPVAQTVDECPSEMRIDPRTGKPFKDKVFVHVRMKNSLDLDYLERETLRDTAARLAIAARERGLNAEHFETVAAEPFTATRQNLLMADVTIRQLKIKLEAEAQATQAVAKRAAPVQRAAAKAADALLAQAAAKPAEPLPAQAQAGSATAAPVAPAKAGTITLEFAGWRGPVSYGTDTVSYVTDTGSDARAAQAQAARPMPQPTPAKATEPAAAQTDTGNAVDDLVNLDEAAVMVHHSKRTLERRLSVMPAPYIQGGGGKASLWKWAELRPWLEKEYVPNLPHRHPRNVR